MIKRTNSLRLTNLINCNNKKRFSVLSLNKNEFIKSYYSYSFTTATTKINSNFNNNNDNSNKIEEFVSQQSKDKIQELLRLFPPIKYGFAYGSGVVIQKGYNSNNNTTTSTLPENVTTSTTNQNNKSNNNDIKKSEPMIDLIFAVENSTKWHSLNLLTNSSHYSFLKYFGASIIAKFQKKGAKIYYNTLLEHNGIKFKYGVIEYNDLIDDLKNWRSLYVSGRMQKPIYNLPQSSEKGLNEILNINQESNLRNAVAASILQLPETFTEYDLYYKICSISYRGDIRWYGGENPNKVHNIIINNLNGFRELYFPVIQRYLSDYLQIYSNGSNNQSITKNVYELNQLLKSINYDTNQLIQFKSTINSHNQINLMMMLPKLASSSLLKIVRKNMIQKKSNQIVDASDTLDISLQRIVRWSSFIQTLRGVFTAGIFKSLNYIRLKLISSKKK